MRFCRNARGLLPFLAVLSFSCVFRGTLTQSAMSARLICARVALPAALFTVRVCAAVCLFCAAVCAACAAVWAVCAAVCAACARGPCALRVYFKVPNSSMARFVCAAVCLFCALGFARLVRSARRYACSARAVCTVCAAVCAACARGPCALRAYFKVSNNSTARFVVSVSAPPLSGSASPALSTSSPKGSPPAVRSSFI